MMKDEWQEVADLIKQLWPRFAGAMADGTSKFHPEYQAAVLAKLEPYMLGEVLGAFRAHRQDRLDEYKPKFDLVVASLKGRNPQTKEWRDEDGRTHLELVAHLECQRAAGLQVLDEAGDEAVDEAWARVLASAANDVKANGVGLAYSDRIRNEGPRKWPVTAAQAVDLYRFDEIMAGR